MEVQLSSEPLYEADYYEALRDGTRRSAAIVVPLLIELFRPRSVVDVGCGLGLWLAAFKDHGVAGILGIDGPWIAREQRQIADAQFREHDLCQPLRIDKKFDLALCLEVAEHLPPEAARPLVETLTGLAPVVVFSAAIPSQGGDGHINERWPSYWSELFAAGGFGYLDGLRGHLWTNDAVEVWYRQNMLCYVSVELIDRVRQSLAVGGFSSQPVDLVHPQSYLRLARENDQWRREAAQWRSYTEVLQAELTRIKNSRPWRLYQAVRPAVKAVTRINSYMQSAFELGRGRPPP